MNQHRAQTKRGFPSGDGGRSLLRLTVAAAALLLVGSAGHATAQITADQVKNFKNPPPLVRPFTWWHWMNGNVTKTGITLDLEAMARVGVGGFQLFDVAQSIPPGPIKYASAEWYELLGHAAEEASRLGLEMDVHNSAGWSSTGGPWITQNPQFAQQSLVWSETFVTNGGKQLSVTLPKPTSNWPGASRDRGTNGSLHPEYYRDIAVLAFRSLPGETNGAEYSGNSARITNWRAKANAAPGSAASPGKSPTPEISGDYIIDPDKVVELTARMDAQGRLTWNLPPGNWTILRFGHAPNGAVNGTAPLSGRGLESDKFSRAAIDFHFDHLVKKILAKMGSLPAKGKAGILIDSYEVGVQNWTQNFPAEFKRARGYELTRYLPAMTGRMVGNADVSERFLWDIRRTQADLMADNYYGRFRELCHARGVKLYAEPYGNGAFDQIQAGSRVDVPMGEFWTRLMYNVQYTKMASSVAHVFGKEVVGAESFTGDPVQAKWQNHPYSMKAQGDLMFTLGLNQFDFHTTVHQPNPTAAPGMTMGRWGTHFGRTTTWHEQSRGWLQYTARCQYLLRQGVFVGDLLYFAGEDAQVQVPEREALVPPPPLGHDYDVTDAEGILKRMKCKDGRIVLPDGMSYRLLVMPNDSRVTLEVLRKVREMVNQGMWLVGQKPQHSPTLSGYPRSDAEVRHLADDLWGDIDGKASTAHTLGKGHVFWGQDLRSVLDKLGAKPDFDFTARSSDPAINYIHRRIGDSEIYFVANRKRRSEDLVCTFRVAGKDPELWNAETGQITPALMMEATDGRTRVTLHLEPAGSVFVVFRGPVLDRALLVVTREGVPLATTKPFPVATNARYRAVTNDFTISVWVKPETDLSFPVEGIRGKIDGFGKSFVFYPPEGDVLYGPGHVGCGLSAGRDGVMVCERGSDYFPAVLVARTPLSGWTHLALLYRNGQSRIYVNGRFLREGLKTGRVVHPGTGAAFHRADVYYFEGDMAEPEVLSEALDDERISKLAAAGPPRLDEPPAFQVDGGEPTSFLFWQDGNYRLNFRDGTSLFRHISGLEQPAQVAGSWRVTFPPGLGAPPEVILDKLIPLNQHSDPGVRYFSGTAKYLKELDIPPQSLAGGKRLFLDLGRVEVIAEVKLNGQDLGVLWKPPFRVDVTAAAHPGKNDLEVRVTDLWVNRLIGDAQLPQENAFKKSVRVNGGHAIEQLPEWYVKGQTKPADQRITFETWQHYQEDSPLVESGLVGPVMLRVAMPAKVTRSGE